MGRIVPGVINVDGECLNLCFEELEVMASMLVVLLHRGLFFEELPNVSVEPRVLDHERLEVGYGHGWILLVFSDGVTKKLLHAAFK